MKAVEIRNLSEKELSEKLVDLKAELFHLRFQHAINQRIRRELRQLKKILPEFPRLSRKTQ